MVCLEDNSVHGSLEDLHKHLRKIRVKQADYYHKHFPKKDLFSGEAIQYDSYEQYMNCDFINKNNLRKFVKANTPEAQAWAIKWLERRREQKKLVYSPTQTELRTLTCPTVKYYNFIGGYNKICAKVGLTPRFTGELKFETLPSDVVVIQDSREQKPIKLELPTVVRALNVGDYGLELNPHNVFIERKSLMDFVGTLSPRKGILDERSNYERFRREIIRAKEANAYLIMLVESDINEALGFNYLPQMRYTKIGPEKIFKNLRDLLQEFPKTFQTVFCKGRDEAARVMIQIFKAGETVKNVDLELAYEEGKL